MPGGKLYVGTSGWSYGHWAKGRFYPVGLKPNQWLGFFSRHFDTVEINASYYRLPKPEMITRWHQQVAGGFRFAVKMWKRITHEKRLADCGEQLSGFLAVVNELAGKRGPLLVQLPPSLQCAPDLLADFLVQLKRTLARIRWRVTIEFRHSSWLCPEAIKLLDEHGVALCLADLPRCPITEPGEAGFVYLRRHGPGGSYGGCYTARQIGADARRIAGWLKAGRDVYVYYNNDIDGYAVDNARQLRERVAKLRG